MANITEVEYASRLAKLQQTLTERGIDLAILNQNTDLFYYTGSVQPLYLLVPAEGRPLALARKAIARIEEEVPHIPLKEFSGSKELVAAIADAELLGSARLGFTLDTTAYSTVARLHKLFPNAELLDISWEIRTLRMVKSPTEISYIRQAGEVMKRVPDILRESFRPGMTELELSAAFEYYFRLNGGDALLRCRKEGVEMSGSGVCSSGVNSLAGTKFDGVCGGKGLNAAVPYGASRSPIEKDVPVILDFGMSMNGYHIDQTRMFVWGVPSDEITRAYDDMLNIEQAIFAMLKPGVCWEEPYSLAVDLAAQSGYKDTFMGVHQEKVKFVGHGLGLELDDPPFLAEKMRDTLAANMILAIEPKVALPGIGVIGIEDTILLTENGVEILTTCPQELIVLSA